MRDEQEREEEIPCTQVQMIVQRVREAVQAVCTMSPYIQVQSGGSVQAERQKKKVAHRTRKNA